MATQFIHGGAPARPYRRVPWSPRAWSGALYLAGGIPALLAAPLIYLVTFVTIHPVIDPQPVNETPEAVLLLAVIWLAVVFLAVPLLTRMHRSRLRAVAGESIPPQPGIQRRLSPRGIVTAARSPATWRQLAYHLLAGPALAVAAVAAIGMWLLGIVCTFTYIYASRLPSSSPLYRGLLPWPGSGLSFHVYHVQLDVYLTIGGILALFAAPRVTAWVAALDASAAQALLGPSRAEELEHRVEHLTQTRAGVVDAADAERRRLERDLHDGTQQRLVSLAMNLGMARAQASTAEEARHAIAEAHEEAKAALAELRDLIRGLHPAVLEDRGLDAALSGVVARMPIPVRLSTELDRRPSPVIEAVAYFVVSEGLANIAKHAQATQASVFVQRARDRLHIIITDDGVGGADPARGTGLAGLARRASAVDGTFEIDSPPGGPTLLTVDLPCAR